MVPEDARAVDVAVLNPVGEPAVVAARPEWAGVLRFDAIPQNVIVPDGIVGGHAAHRAQHDQGNDQSYENVLFHCVLLSLTISAYELTGLNERRIGFGRALYIPWMPAASSIRFLHNSPFQGRFEDGSI